MFCKTPHKHPIVYLKDVPGKDLEALLDFMYKGEVNVPQTDLASLIKTAEGLQIKGLAVPDDAQFLRARATRGGTAVPDPHLGGGRTPAPEPSSSPPPPRKKRHRGGGIADLAPPEYAPVTALNTMYSNMSSPPTHHHHHHQEPNSPYDLSQKSLSSSSQSDERTHSISPDHPTPQSHSYQAPSSSSSSSSYVGHNKEASPDDLRSPPNNAHTPQPSRTPQPSHTPQSTTSQPPRTPQTPHTPSSDVNCSDRHSDDQDPVPGPSGVKGRPIKEEEDDTVSFLLILTLKVCIFIPLVYPVQWLSFSLCEYNPYKHYNFLIFRHSSR